MINYFYFIGKISRNQNQSVAQKIYHVDIESPASSKQSHLAGRQFKIGLKDIQRRYR